jgi:hypothetical protein
MQKEVLLVLRTLTTAASRAVQHTTAADAPVEAQLHCGVDSCEPRLHTVPRVQQMKNRRVANRVRTPALISALTAAFATASRALASASCLFAAFNSSCNSSNITHNAASYCVPPNHIQTSVTGLCTTNLIV